MPILNVAPGDLVTTAEGHRTVAGQIDTALAAAVPPVATMPATYGPVGAVFIAAIDQFHTTLTATGTALVDRYQDMSETLRDAAGRYASVDGAGGVAIADGFTDTI